jgi:hypothetical protein
MPEGPEVESARVLVADNLSNLVIKEAIVADDESECFVNCDGVHLNPFSFLTCFYADDGSEKLVRQSLPLMWSVIAPCSSLFPFLLPCKCRVRVSHVAKV